MFGLLTNLTNLTNSSTTDFIVGQNKLDESLANVLDMPPWPLAGVKWNSCNKCCFNWGLELKTISHFCIIDHLECSSQGIVRDLI